MGNRLYPNPLKSRDSATFTGSYQTLGTVLEHPCRLVKLTNNSTVFITISWDGINDHEVLPAGSFLLIDVSSNRQVSEIYDIAEGTQFLVKGSAGTGSVYLSSYFAQ